MFGFKAQKLPSRVSHYHLSFYHVASSTTTNIDSGYRDDRAVRKMSPFAAGPKRKVVISTRNSCPSFPLAMVRMFTQIFSLLRNTLAIRVTTPMMPFYKRSECDSSSAQGPRHEDCEARSKGIAFFIHQRMLYSVFLAWIANSMRHVVARWQGAIVAVDKEVQPEFRSIFHGDKHSLLSDDSSFPSPRDTFGLYRCTKSSRRNWARQYPSWEKFEAKLLRKLDDRQLDNHKGESLEIIHTAIGALKRKRDNIRLKRAEVSDMKDGDFTTPRFTRGCQNDSPKFRSS
jgi:hypothetical protein